MNDDAVQDDDAFMNLLAACDDAMAAGSTPPIPEDDGAIAPDLQPRLRRGLACLELLNGLRATPAPDHGGTWPNLSGPSRPGDAPDRLGRFVIRRELGRGGFGVVFLAFDTTLRREVALKVPHPQALASASLRRRFRREAHAAASLDHPNLVPVYEWGEAGPVCYIASFYCPGPTLATWLKDRTEPVSPRRAAELVAAMADAIQHAHSRGVLHRDLKPSNVLLAPSAGDKAATDGADLVPRVTDFGLARCLDPSDSDQAEDGDAGVPTHSGVVAGTPSYMAPEQTGGRGGEIGPVTDVYGLGAVLYECLAGRPPFLSDSALDTMRQVLADEPVAPRLLRRRLPLDLETICLKCLEKEPRRRYPSAAAVAEDLRRYLDGKPIVARPVGRVARGWRWCRREPRVASLILLVVLAVLGGFAGVSWQWQRAERQTILARNERDLARLERVRAEGHFRKARSVVDRLAKLAEDLRYQPRLGPTRRLVLAEVSEFYQGFLAEKSTDPGVRFEAARICNRLAEVRDWMGQWDKEEEAIRRGGELLDSLLIEYPGNARYREERTNGYWRLGNFYKATSRHLEAVEAFGKSIASEKLLIADYPDEIVYQSQLANTYMNLASSERDLARKEDAREHSLLAIDFQRRCQARLPDNPYYQRELALGVDGLGRILREEGRYPEAEVLCREALGICRKLAATHPEVFWNNYFLTVSQAELAQILIGTNRRPEAEENLRTAIGTLEALLADFPEFRAVREALASCSEDLGKLLDVPGRFAESATCLHRAMENFDKLIAIFPDSKDVLESACRTRLNLGQVLQQAGQFAEASKVLSEALRRWPARAGVQNDAARFFAACPAPEFRNPSRAAKLAKSATDADPKNGSYWNTYGVAQYRNGDFPASLAAFETSMQLRKGGDAYDWIFLAMIRAQRGEPALAREWFDRAASWIAREKPADPELGRFRAEAEALLASPHPERP
ncbi:MAG: Serine/threonine protein kinase PrkC, regulator of stationary phase [Planctomycetota bacterium]|nr:Serine/threonine protein kinase PrkC, regulator of stationary phase [Planctomycetota bacterium]